MRTPRVCDWVVDWLRRILLHLKAKSRVLKILLNEVSSYCLKRYCAGMSLAAPRGKAESNLWASLPARVFLLRILFTKISVRSFMNRIVRVSNRLFACRTGLVAPSAFVCTFCTMLVRLRGCQTNVDYFSSPFRSMAMDDVDFMSAPKCAIFRSNLLAWRASIACDSQCSDTGIDCKHRWSYVIKRRTIDTDVGIIIYIPTHDAQWCIWHLWCYFGISRSVGSLNNCILRMRMMAGIWDQQCA